MALSIEYLHKEDLKPYAGNAKLHPAEQVEQIKSSIRQFGFNDPIALWGENEVVEGHGRLLAVMEMDEISEVPVIRLDSLSEEQKKAYALVHNKLTMNSGFDFDLLQLELDSLDLDMGEFGFDIDSVPDPLPPVNDGDETSGFHYTEQYGVIVMCEGEAEQESIYNELTEKGYNCKVVAV